LGFLKEDIQNALSSGAFVDSSNADLTSSNIHLNLGHMQALNNAQQFITLFNKFQVIEEEGTNV